MYVAINVDEARMVAKNPDPHVATELAYVRIPPSQRAVVGHIKTAATLSGIGLEEMGQLYESLTGGSAKGIAYSGRLKRVQSELMELPVDKATITKAENMDPEWSNEDEPPQEKGASRTAMRKREPGVPPPPVRRQATQPAGRPEEGTTTGRVWAIADALLLERPGEAGTKSFRGGVVARCQEEGINTNTTITQYGRWNRARLAGVL